jgi:endonuclease YncB( thermonuclease family)
MFLRARALPGSPPILLLGLVFVAGMVAGAALRPSIPMVVGDAIGASGANSAQAGTPAREVQRLPSGSQASVGEGTEAKADEISAGDRPSQVAAPSLQDLRLAAGGHPAEVLRVNDGDTFEARVHVWPGMQVTTKVRLRGIDAAEFRARCAEEYRLAGAARDALARLLAEGGVTIGRIDFDKYGGRVVANASTRNTPDISDALLKMGLVRAYDGGRRDGWCGG